MIVQRTRTYAVCPHCQADAGTVDHLIGTVMSTRWYCDSCGGEYGLAFHASGEVAITSLPGRLVKTLDVLILRPQKKPVYFVVEGMRFEGKISVAERLGGTTSDVADSKQFFYESHSCPTNWLKPQMVYHDGDSDPHGLIEFVSTVDVDSIPEDEDVGPNDHDAALVALVEKHIAANQGDTHRDK